MKQRDKSAATNKDRLVTILEGGVPDHPPHFEIVFQLGREFFGLDWQAVVLEKVESQ